MYEAYEQLDEAWIFLSWVYPEDGQHLFIDRNTVVIVSTSKFQQHSLVTHWRLSLTSHHHDSR